MTPAVLLIALVALAAGLLWGDGWFRRRRARRVSALGRPARMHYAAVDRFGLTDRLIREPSWQGHTPGIEVKDVLYASAGGERCFICVAKCRYSMDDAESRSIVRAIERLSDGAPVELVTIASTSPREDDALFAELIEGWVARHPAAPPTPSSPPTTASPGAASSGSSSPLPR